MDKQKIVDKILTEVKPIAEEKVKEIFGKNDVVDEFKASGYDTVSEIERKNEQYVKDICDKYGLEYSENDGVYGEKRQLNAMKTVYKLISQKMEVGKFRWLDGADNCYAFSFYSKHPITL